MSIASDSVPVSRAKRRRSGVAGPIAAYGVALLVAAPVLFVLASFFKTQSAAQAHIWTTTGPHYLLGTLSLCAAVGAGAAVIGIGAAALVALTRFPGRRVLSVALVLPFAVPAYVNAYVYGDLLGPFGLIGGAFRPNPPEIRSLPGAAFILTLSVYPYVYLAARASLEARSGAMLEAARALGASPARAVWIILLPAGRAAIAGGLALALMETAADFGVADYFGVATLSVGVFRTWYGLGDLTAASQIAGGLFVVALFLVLLEQAARRGSGAESARVHRGAARLTLSPMKSIGAFLFCALPAALGFAAPVAVLAAKLGAPAAGDTARALGGAALNTAAVAALGAASALILASILVYRARRPVSMFEKAAIRVSTLGYALPGAVIAIGILAFHTAAKDVTGLTVTGVALLIYAYAARFMTAGYNAVAGGAGQIHPLTDDAARTLGAGPLAILRRIHFPMMRPAIAAGALVIFIDIAKELPATLLLRPFNFETLATHIYRLASDERLAAAAPAALMLIAVSLIPALWVDAIARGGKPSKIRRLRPPRFQRRRQ